MKSVSCLLLLLGLHFLKERVCRVLRRIMIGKEDDLSSNHSSGHLCYKKRCRDSIVF
jgi:hypothetical protein